jgi:hypothetical protein
MLKLDSKFSVFSYWHLFVCSMEHQSDGNVLTLHDETDDQIKVESGQQETEDLFRQIDEALAEEPIVNMTQSVTTSAQKTKSRCVPLPHHGTHVTAPSQPAGKSSRLKRAFTPVQATDRGMPKIVTHVAPNLTITPMVAGTSRINTNLLNRLGPAVKQLAARLGPPNTRVAPEYACRRTSCQWHGN